MGPPDWDRCIHSEIRRKIHSQAENPDFLVLAYEKGCIDAVAVDVGVVVAAVMCFVLCCCILLL